ncbi:LIM and SH3 domain protein Lasp-like [Oppia nitens]|uniref:LIM and SH3 domain protein Lasp-like n=1 Tax=Oppia nitens TaxID=1686743 RepID=UPI0023DBE509|nr:LIM and SH3 domain protein Lasp-like [Oppia nitens]
MSAKKCSRCDKTVYPIEELKCLDKVWHKLCFKCQECGMTLNMKNYKGFNKLPYCNAHCPQARATAVADTPEARRLAENTKLQSQVKYHEDFERQKGKLTQVADDPETLRIRNISQRISNAAYHGEYEKKKQMEQKRNVGQEDNRVSNGFSAVSMQHTAAITTPASHIIDENKNSRQTIQLQQQQQQHNDSINHNIRNSGDNNTYLHNVGPQSHAFHTNNNNNNKDMNAYPSKSQSNVIYTSDEGPVNENSKKVGSIADYDPINDNYGSIASGYRIDNTAAYYTGGPQTYTQVVSNTAIRRPTSRSFRAIYDYTAQDIDEVSFLDGDVIVNCVPIDEGWMTGTVQRTGQTGMLPSNYVESYN